MINLYLSYLDHKEQSHITNRSNKNMLPQPIFNFKNYRDLDIIVEL